MSERQQTPERQFLTELVLREFNHRTGTNLQYEDTIIYSVPPSESFRHCYEINRRIAGDFLRIHLYLNVGNTDLVRPYTLEAKPIFKPGVLGDEVFVFRGTIDTAHTLYDGYRLPWIGEDLSLLPLLVQTDSAPFLLTDGSYIALAQG